MKRTHPWYPLTVAEAEKIHQSNANAAIIHPSAANRNRSYGSTGFFDLRIVWVTTTANVSTTASSPAPAILPASAQAGWDTQRSARVRTVSAAAMTNRLREASSGRHKVVNLKRGIAW